MPKLQIRVRNLKLANLATTAREILVIVSQVLYCLHRPQVASLTVHFLEAKAIKSLNSRFRLVNKATNILAFPNVIPSEFNTHNYLGELYICPEVMAVEYKQYGNFLNHHYCHIIIHGLLHLLGYEHNDESSENYMVWLEQEVLFSLLILHPIRRNHLTA